MFTGFLKVPIKHGQITTSSFQQFEVVYKLTQHLWVYQIFFIPVEPLERVVPASDAQNVGPHPTWKPVCVCVCVFGRHIAPIEYICVHWPLAGSNAEENLPLRSIKYLLKCVTTPWLWTCLHWLQHMLIILFLYLSWRGYPSSKERVWWSEPETQSTSGGLCQPATGFGHTTSWKCKAERGAAKI